MKTIEHNNQAELIYLCRLYEHKIPELGLLFAIPNGGHRFKGVARKLKTEGVSAGTWDLLLVCARNIYHGYWIEMKSGKNKLTAEQKEFQRDVENEGYKTEVFYSGLEAFKAVVEYITGKSLELNGIKIF